jgi:cation diffusion facilitator family transporter
VAALPPDEEHTYGHTKAEYFSSGVEAVLIMVAAAGIAWAAAGRLLHPAPLEDVWIGAGISVVASAVNGGVAFVLLRAGERLHSIGLKADAHHLFTDVWTSAGVIAAILLVKATGWLILDPLIAIGVALNIVRIGVRMLDDTVHGLLDTALPSADQQTIRDVLAPFRERGIEFHAFRSRMSGQRRFVSMHILVPGSWTVQQGHDLCEEIERSLCEAMPRTTIFTHLEPLDDPAAFIDQTLDRS